MSGKELAETRHNGSRLPPSPAIICFDDRLKECFTVACPVLLRHGLPCLFFVSPALVDNGRMFFRHTVSLCIDESQRIECTNAAEAPRVYRALINIAPVEIGSRRAFVDWILSPSDEAERLIERVASILGVDVRSYLDRESPFMTSEQISQLIDDRFEVGAHGHAHRALRALDGAEIEADVASCIESMDRNCYGATSSQALCRVDHFDPKLLEGIGDPLVWSSPGSVDTFQLAAAVSARNSLS